MAMATIFPQGHVLVSVGESCKRALLAVLRVGELNADSPLSQARSMVSLSFFICFFFFFISDNLHKSSRARQGQSALVPGEAPVRSYTMSIIITMAAEHLHQGLRVSAVPVLLWEIIQPLAIGVKLNSVTSLLRAAL